MFLSHIYSVLFILKFQLNFIKNQQQKKSNAPEEQNVHIFYRKFIKSLHLWKVLLRNKIIFFRLITFLKFFWDFYKKKIFCCSFVQCREEKKKSFAADCERNKHLMNNCEERLSWRELRSKINFLLIFFWILCFFWCT